jgi:YggT family protein
VVYMLIYRGLDLLFQGLYLALLVRVLLSWIPHDPYHPIVSFLYRITDPILKPFRDIVPPHRIGFDISPLFAFLALSLLRKLIFSVMI